MVELRTYIPTTTDEATAYEVSRWIAEYPTEMIQRSPEQILELFHQRRSLIVQQNIDGEWKNVGHVAFTVVDGDRAELGAVVTLTHRRGNGIAKHGIKSLLNSAVEPEVQTVYAFTHKNNEEGITLFQRVLQSEGIIGAILDTALAPSVFFKNSTPGKERDVYYGFLFRRNVR